MAKGSDAPEFVVPPIGSEGGTADVREEFAKVTEGEPNDEAAVRAFVASKVHMLRSHPLLRQPARATLAAKLEDRIAVVPETLEDGPTPGGVGYGVFYKPDFKSAYATGTAIYWEIICPNPPGGNVETWLYQTATNRSACGVEAFIAYYGQDETTFKVFDWARPDQWQTNVPFSSLGSYLTTSSAHGTEYQTLPVLNITAQREVGSWYNQVWLLNTETGQWDLIYQYDYSSTLEAQQSGWVGSWGPIVETFQELYQGTSPMGALTTMLSSCDENGQWSAWELLSPENSDLRSDNKGFDLEFLDPNHSWAVIS